MRALRRILESQHKHFVGKGRLRFFHPLFELIDTFLYTPGETTSGDVHVRDALDLKRMMITVVVALIPCIFWAMYNTGFQAQSGIISMGLDSVNGWRGSLFHLFFPHADPQNIVSCLFLGALYFVPVYLVTNIVGGLCEAVFSLIRRHEVNEGFLVTGILFPLTLPPTIPLWQVAVGIAFGVVIGKEVFGGTGKNFLNPALTARAFLFFSYPAQISGDLVWVAADGYSGATLLSQAASGGMGAFSHSWWEAFIGLIPGSMGETSTLACLLGALVLVVTGVGSWRIMLSMTLSTVLFAMILNLLGSDNPIFGVTPGWHLVLGGYAFGCIFMATDPVSASMTDAGKWVYGALIGFMVIVVRSVNPAYPEGVMLAILFGNIFAPLIDYFVVNANVKRRMSRFAER